MFRSVQIGYIVNYAPKMKQKNKLNIFTSEICNHYHIHMQMGAAGHYVQVSVSVAVYLYLVSVTLGFCFFGCFGPAARTAATRLSLLCCLGLCLGSWGPDFGVKSTVLFAVYSNNMLSTPR